MELQIRFSYSNQKLMIKILDYGLGNIKAFINAYDRIGVRAKSIQNFNEISTSDKLILPGVGHFDYAITKLSNQFNIKQLNKIVLDQKTPILGVCVGMQIMCESSEEGQLKGLGWFPNSVKKLPEKDNFILPHMGWNSIDILKSNPLFKDLNEGKNSMYFLHSYFCDTNDDLTYANTSYTSKFQSIIIRENVYGIQGHPEKSHEVGERLLKNFSEL